MRTIVTSGRATLRPNRSATFFASTTVEKTLRDNRLAEVGAVFSHAAAVKMRHDGRGVFETRLIDAVGRSIRVFIKLNWGRRKLWPRMTDLKTGQFLHSLPVREWNGLQLLESIGLHVPERFALFEEGIFQTRSAVIIREVPAPASVDEMLQDGTWPNLTGLQRESLLEAMVHTLRTIHRAGLGWRGAGSRHFLPQLQADESWKVWLIDCEGVHGRVSPKVIQRDFNKLTRSMISSGADQTALGLLQKLISSAPRQPHAMAA